MNKKKIINKQMLQRFLNIINLLIIAPLAPILTQICSWVKLQDALFWNWLYYNVERLASDLVYLVSKEIPHYFYKCWRVLLWYLTSFFYVCFNIIIPITGRTLKELKKIVIISYYVSYKYLRQAYLQRKAESLLIYRHVIEYTAESAKLVDERLHLLNLQQNFKNQRQKAPSLWILKLDFLAFFSILNRLFSVALILFVFVCVFVLFLYNLKIQADALVMFYIMSCGIFLIIIHIGFSYVKMALILDNYRKLVSNAISNIKRMYILIYAVLFIIVLICLSSNLMLAHEIQNCYFAWKTWYFNVYGATFLRLTGYADLWLPNFSIGSVFIFCYGLAKYLIICLFIVNYNNFFKSVVYCTCVWKTLHILKKIYCKYNVHIVLYMYPELIAIVAYDAHNNVTRRVMFNPNLRVKYDEFTDLIDSVSEITYSVMYRNFDFEHDGLDATKFVKFMEDVYLYIGLRTYRTLLLAYYKPALFKNFVNKTKSI